MAPFSPRPPLSNGCAGGADTCERSLDPQISPVRAACATAPLRDGWFVLRRRATGERFADSVETAAYFIACEGLTNAVKHAHASKVIVSAAPENGNLVVRVADDGVGGAAPGNGSGLAGIADRIAAQGGSLRIESRPGEGTSLIAELPCAS